MLHAPTTIHQMTISEKIISLISFVMRYDVMWCVCVFFPFIHFSTGIFFSRHFKYWIAYIPVRAVVVSLLLFIHFLFGCHNVQNHSDIRMLLLLLFLFEVWRRQPNENGFSFNGVWVCAMCAVCCVLTPSPAARFDVLLIKLITYEL